MSKTPSTSSITLLLVVYNFLLPDTMVWAARHLLFCCDTAIAGKWNIQDEKCNILSGDIALLDSRHHFSICWRRKVRGFGSAIVF